MPFTTEEIRDCARAAEMVRHVLGTWDYKTWNQVLADDVSLTLNWPPLGVGVGGTGSTIAFTGGDAAEGALRDFYGSLKDDVSIVGQLLVGREAILFGELNASTDVSKTSRFPIALYLRFNDNGKVQKMKIETIDVSSLLREIWEAITG